jgi:hypothetical protein
MPETARGETACGFAFKETIEDSPVVGSEFTSGSGQPQSGRQR